MSFGRNQHCVARCPCCDRPIWHKRLAQLLGLVPLAPPRRSSLGFVAESTPGKRGWRIIADMASCAAVESHAGSVAVEQLRRLARQTLERIWLFGLISRTDVDAVTRTESLPRTTPTVTTASHETYVPRPAPPPVRTLLTGTWKP